jgi:hypothetical protein
MTPRENAVAATVAASISRELDEDYVEMWKLSRRIREEWPEATGREVRTVAGMALTILVQAGSRLGDIDWETGEFRPWPSGGAVERAVSAWDRLGREPNLGDIGWLYKPTSHNLDIP